MTFPDRIGPLILRLERGEPVTQEEVDRLAVIQALDLARIGQEFARQMADADREHAKFLEAMP